ADHHEHAHFAAAIQHDASAVRASLLDRVVPEKSSGLLGRLTNPVRRLAVRWGAPLHFSLWRRRHRRGALINRLRQRRGLPQVRPLDAGVDDLRLVRAMRSDRTVRPGTEVGFGASGEGFRMRAGGWSIPTTESCEMADTGARLLLTLPPWRCDAVELSALSA